MESGVYNINDDEAVSTNELIDIICSAMGKKAHIWRIPRGLMDGVACGIAVGDDGAAAAVVVAPVADEGGKPVRREKAGGGGKRLYHCRKTDKELGDFT